MKKDETISAETDGVYDEPGLYFLKILLYAFSSIISIGIIVIIITQLTKPTLTKIEYFEDNSSTVTMALSYIGPDAINVSTECGDMRITNDEYYRYYRNRIGTSVTAKFEKRYYSDGSTSLRVYEVLEIIQDVKEVV